MRPRRHTLSSLLATTLCMGCAAQLPATGVLSGPSVSSASPASANWLHNGGPESNQYSPLDQINAGNVAQLQVAWRFELEEGRLQAQPLVIDDVFYAPTPGGDLVALDAATGELKWRFAPGVPAGQPIRGLTSHGEGAAMRLLFATRNYLYSIDPATGQPITSFGENGRIDVNANLRGPPSDNGMYLTSPGVVYGDVYIFSGRVSESTPASPGHIRAVDVHTGAVRWTFHTIPHPGEFGADTWPEGSHLTQGGANAWVSPAVDPARGIVYVTTGSPADDFYGGERLGDNLFANTLIALDANTGRRLWHFQAVRHDLWDMDFNNHPVLLSVLREGRRVDAVAVTPKTGHVFIFDRVTGEPLFPIDEIAVPGSTVPGEIAAATQPIPRLPAPLARTNIGPDDLTDRTPAAAEWARGVYATLNGSGRQFVPMTIGQDTLVMAGFIGGVGWGGMAADPNGVLYANATDVPGISRIVESRSLLGAGIGDRTYQQQCSACHGAERQGVAGVFPELTGVGERLSDAQIADVIRNGRGRMPGFANLPADTVANLISYLKTGRDLEGASTPAISLQGRFAPSVTTYTSNGNRNFVDPDGFPGVKPPWGTLSAIDMNTGQYRWRVPFGSTEGYGTRFGGRNTGGAVVTSGGLLFIGATADRMFHAFDAATGRLLWEAMLSAPGEATPAVYMSRGRQFVAIAASERVQGGNAAPAPPPPAASSAAAGLAAEGAGHSANTVAAPSALPPPRNAYIVFALPR